MTQTPYQMAQGFTGTREGDAKLDSFLNNGGAGLSSAEYAWCARFVKAAAQNAGVDVSKMTDMARSALSVGSPTDKPNQGDIAVFSRGSDPSKGHVGFFEGFNPDGSIKVLSGNHADQVASASYPASRLLGFRTLGDGTPANDPRNVAMNGGSAGVDPDGAAGVAGAIQTAVPQGAQSIDSGVKMPEPPAPLTGSQQGQGMLAGLFDANDDMSMGDAFKAALGGLGKLGAGVPTAQAPAMNVQPGQAQAPNVNMSALLQAASQKRNWGV